MKTEKWTNGQICITSENLKMIHTISPVKHNDCAIYDKNTNCWESVSQDDERFKPLFIALHNFKNN